MNPALAGVLIGLGSLVCAILGGFYGAGKRVGQQDEKFRALERLFIDKSASQDRLIAEFKDETRDLREENRVMAQQMGEVRGQLLRINGGGRQYGRP